MESGGWPAYSGTEPSIDDTTQMALHLLFCGEGGQEALISFGYPAIVPYIIPFS
jgi:hypothetical protein